MESLAELYYQKLIDSDNKIPVLVGFFSALFNPPSIGGLDYAMFGKMIKIYGEKIVFYSILDMADMEEVDLNSYHRLLSYFAKKRLERVLDTLPSNYLDDRVKEVEQSLNKKRKPKVKSDPFEENNEKSIIIRL